MKTARGLIIIFVLGLMLFSAIACSSTSTSTTSPLQITTFQNEWDVEDYLLTYIYDSATTYHGQQVLAEFWNGDIYHGEYTENSDGSWTACPKLSDVVIEGSELLEPIFQDRWCDSVNGEQCQWGVDWNCCWAKMCFLVKADGTIQANNGNAIRLMAELQQQ